jgi:hypothetical protein
MNSHLPGESTPRRYPGPIRTMAAMQPRLVAVALLALALVGCDVAASSSPLEPTPGDPGSSAAPVVPGATAVPGGSGAPATGAPATQAPTAPTTAPTAAPRTNPPPPPSGAKVVSLPSNTGPIGSMFLLQLTGFPAGRVSETITNPAGVPKVAFITAGADGATSVTFQTQLTDQPGIGKYTFRFDSGTVSVTTTITVTRAQ